MNLVIHTDGACSGNPGPGGWGVMMRHSGAGGDTLRELSGGEAATTNNRMEMTAAIRALEAVEPDFAGEVVLWTDSTYVLKGITEWIHGWKRRGWKTAARKPVKNADLWRELDALNGSRSVEWRWVKGHAGDPGNERADALANLGMEPFKGGNRTRR